MKDRQIHICLNVFLKWAAENGSFYLATWICGLCLPKEQRIFKEGKESLGQMALLEALDTALRLSLFLVSCFFPNAEELVTGIGSLLLDVVFVAGTAKSHRLWQIATDLRRKISSFPLVRREPILVLGLERA